MKVTVITTVGRLDVEMTFLPADPDSGFPEPYIDDIDLYYANTDRPITKTDWITLEEDNEIDDIKREYISQISEQAAIAQAYSRRADA